MQNTRRYVIEPEDFVMQSSYATVYYYITQCIHDSCVSRT